MKAIPPIQRVAEATFAFALALISIPLITCVAVLSFAHYRVWPFFVHSRVGLNGAPFRLVKLRTLPPSTHRYADKYSLASAEVPSVMRLVRRLHLDELPQLLHIIAGTMTFVGPRPEMHALHERLPTEFANERTSVRPGITCLWQISAHNAGLIGERPEYDMLYVRHRSRLLDLWIVGRTIAKMLGGRAVHLHEVPQWAMITIRPGARIVPTRGVHAATAASAARPAAGLID